MKGGAVKCKDSPWICRSLTVTETSKIITGKKGQSEVKETLVFVYKIC